MKKSKIFKKLLAVILAGATLYQTGFGHCETSAKSSNTSTKVLATLATVGGLAVIGLAGGLICKSEEVESQKRELDARSQLIADQNSKLIRMRHELSDKDFELMRKDTELSHKDIDLAFKVAELSGKKAELINIKGKLEAIETELELTKSKLASTERDLDYAKKCSAENETYAAKQREYADGFKKIAGEAIAHMEKLEKQKAELETQVRNLQDQLKTGGGSNEKLVQEIAEDIIEFAKTNSITKTFLNKLKPLHANKEFNQSDIYNILISLELCSSAIQRNEYGQFLNACSFEDKALSNKTIFQNCAKSLQIILKQMIDNRYNCGNVGGVENLKKSSYLQSLTKILG